MAYITVSADVEVDLDDIIEAARESDLIAALQRHHKHLATQFFGRSDAKKEARAAIENDDLQALADIIRPLVCPDEERRAALYAKLARDPATGRPVIQ